MADKILSSTVLCLGGLDSTENHILLDNNYPGKATSLVNYEVGLNGGYSRIEGYEPLSPTYPEVDPDNAEGRVLGIAVFTDNDGTTLFIAARKQQGEDKYNFYYLNEGVGWVMFTTGLTLSSIGVSKIRHSKFNIDGVNYIVFVDGVNNATLTNGTDWYSLNSANSGTEGSPGGNQLIDAPSYVTVFKNHVFLSGDSDYPAIVSHSAPLDPFDWTTANGGGQILTEFAVNQIKPFRDNLYVFGKKNISKISTESTSFVLNPVTTNIGCISSDSVIEINGDILFLAPDGIRTVAGTEKIGDIELACVSKPIQELVNFLQMTYPLENLNSVVIRSKSQFRYFISLGTGTDVGRGIIGGLRISDQLNGWEFGELQGIRSSIADSDYVGDTEYIIHGDYDGKVYRQERSDSFDGRNVVSVYATPFLSFETPTIRKSLRTITTFYKLNGSASLSLGVKFDWDRSNVLNPLNYTQEEIITSVKYDQEFKYDQGNKYMGGSFSPVMTTNIEGSGDAVQFIFTASDTNPPHTIQGFIVEYTPESRR